jgi:uncharacterized metal-binding protein YceD (DUF177 family)
MRDAAMSDLSEVYSRKLRAAQVKEAPQTHKVTASPAECAALAAVFGLPGIAALEGDFVLRHEQGGMIAAALALRARVTQVCVITLEPFEAAVAETAALLFVPAARVSESAALAQLDAETLEGPDEIPYAGESIDLGAALAEQLALSLDPYPKKPGAVLPEGVGAEVETPFAVLKGRRTEGE